LAKGRLHSGTPDTRRRRFRRSPDSFPFWAIQFSRKLKGKILVRYSRASDMVVLNVRARSAELAIADAEKKFVELCGADNRKLFEIQRVEYH
jgi:hypothetical protein